MAQHGAQEIIIIIFEYFGHKTTVNYRAKLKKFF